MKLLHPQKWGASRFCKMFLSHSTAKLVGVLLCFRKCSCMEKTMERSEGITFLRRFFCLTVPKNFAGEPFFLSKISGNIKFSCIGGGGPRNSRSCLVSHHQNFRRETLMFQKCCGLGKNMDERMGIRSSFSIGCFFVSQCRKIIKGEPLCISKISANEIFHA